MLSCLSGPTNNVPERSICFATDVCFHEHNPNCKKWKSRLELERNFEGHACGMVGGVIWFAPRVLFNLLSFSCRSLLFCLPHHNNQQLTILVSEPPIRFPLFPPKKSFSLYHHTSSHRPTFYSNLQQNNPSLIH